MCFSLYVKWLGLNRSGGGSRSGLGPGLRAFDTVLGTADTAFFDTGSVERAADDMVTNAREILHTAATDEHNGVFLKVVAFIRDIGDDLITVGEAHLGDLP